MPTQNLRDANLFQDFTVWINDIGKIGQSPGFQPPEINIQTEEYRGGGMDGSVEIPTGVEKIEFDFDLHTYDSDVWDYLGYGPGSLDTPITFRGYLLSPNKKESGVLIETNSLIKAVKTNKIEAGKKVEMTITCVANFYKHTIDGKTVNEIDVFNKVMFVNNKDILSQARQILGLTY